MLVLRLIGCICCLHPAQVKGLWLLLLCVLHCAASASVVAEENNSTTAELGKMLSSSTLIAREIEVQMVALQLDLVEGRRAAGSHHLTQAVVGFYEQRQYRPIWDQAVRLLQLITALG